MTKKGEWVGFDSHGLGQPSAGTVSNEDEASASDEFWLKGGGCEARVGSLEDFCPK
jgi:hypothetical protein